MGLFDKLQKKVQDTLQGATPESLMKSVQEKLQNAMPAGMLKGMQDKGMAQMVETMSPAQVDEMEKQGYDVAELRQAVLARIEKEKARVYRLDGLEPYKKVPRDRESEFFKDLTARGAPLVGKDKWLEQCVNAPLIYAAVVQAHQGLWKPDDYGNMGVVFVFSPGSGRTFDVEWLREVAGKISAVRDAPASAAPDCRKLVDSLRNEQSRFCLPVGASLAGGVEAWCATEVVGNQSLLPHKCLPYDRIVPLLLLEPPREMSADAAFKWLPAKYLL